MLKRIIIFISFLFILLGFYLISEIPEQPPVYSTTGEDSMAWLENEEFHPDDMIPTQYREKKQWIPVEVIECFRQNNGKYEITFANNYYIVSDTPSKIGDTDRCWINSWYYSKEYPTSDSVIFENPYKK